MGRARDKYEMVEKMAGIEWRSGRGCSYHGGMGPIHIKTIS